MKITELWQDIPFNQISSLYKAVGWSAYTRDITALIRAFENSDSVHLAVENQKVIGLTRSLSDLVSIHYLQDILVHPDHQRRGIGRKLLEHTLAKYSQVRTHMILTDDEEKQRKFYESLGFKNTKDLKETVLNSFVRMKGMDLK